MKTGGFSFLDPRLANSWPTFCQEFADQVDRLSVGNPLLSLWIGVRFRAVPARQASDQIFQDRSTGRIQVRGWLPTINCGTDDVEMLNDLGHQRWHQLIQHRLAVPTRDRSCNFIPQQVHRVLGIFGQPRHSRHSSLEFAVTVLQDDAHRAELRQCKAQMVEADPLKTLHVRIPESFRNMLGN